MATQGETEPAVRRRTDPKLLQTAEDRADVLLPRAEGQRAVGFASHVNRHVAVFIGDEEFEYFGHELLGAVVRAQLLIDDDLHLPWHGGVCLAVARAQGSLRCLKSKVQTAAKF